MIQFRLESYEEKAKHALWINNAFEYAVQLEDLVFIAEESGRLLGTCVFAYQSGAADTAIVKSIFIAPEARNQNFGDGLIRSTLHYLDRQGVKNVKFISNRDLAPLFRSEGFVFVNEGEFVTKLPDFFLKPCKGNGK